MSELTGPDAVADDEKALQREIDNLTERFPGLERNEIDVEVHRTYNELERNASIRTHLVTVTAAHVGDVLRNRGEHFQPRSATSADTAT
jgi:hypothetical protein